MTDVFISYAREDRRFVQRLHDALAKAGRASWVDWEGIPASAKWMAEVRSAIDEADCFCFVVSPDSVESPVCREEAAHAAASNKRILPLLHRPVDDGLVPETVAAHNWIAFDDQGAFDEAFATLVKALETDPEHLRTHTRLLVKAKEWDGSKDRAKLLRGSDLTTAEAWLGASTAKQPAPTPLHSAYVLASRRAASHRQRTTIGAVAIALVLSLVLATVAVIQRGAAIEQRDLARAGDLASSASAALQRDPELALLLALEAARVRRTDRVESVLRDALDASLLEFTFQGHEGKVADLAFGPDGSTVASVGYDNTILVWEIGSGTIQQTIRSDDVVWSLAFDPGGRWIAGGLNGRVVLWSVESGAVARRIDVTGTVYQVEFAAGGDLLVSGGDDGTHVWQASTGREIVSIPAGPGGTFGADVTDEGDLIATGNGDGTIRIFDGRTGIEHALTAGHDDLAFFVRFDDDGDQVLSVGVDRTARVWDADSGRQLIVMPHAALVEDASFIGEHYVVTVDAEGIGRIWDLTSGEMVAELLGHTAFTAFVTVSPSDDRIATASDDGTVRIWRPGSTVSTLDIERAGFAFAADYVPRSRTLVTAGEGSQIETWDARSGDPGSLLIEAADDVRFLDVSVGSTIAAAAYYRTRDETVVAGGVTFADVVTGDRGATFAIEGDVYPLTLSLDPSGERTISLWTDGTVRIVDRSGTELAHMQVAEPHTRQWSASLAEFADDGSRIVVADGPRIDLIDPETAEILRTFAAADAQVTTIGLSPSGTRLAAGFDDSTARIWDVRTGDELATLRGHTGNPSSVAFSPDGAYVVTAAMDGTSRVWTTQGDQIEVLHPGEFIVTDASFSDDGGDLAVAALVGFRGVPTSVGYDPEHRTVLRVYSCDVCRSYNALLSLARSHVTRQLSAAERSEYLA